MVLQIILALLILLIVIIYLTNRDASYFPFTKVYMTNTTIVGRILGV